MGPLAMMAASKGMDIAGSAVNAGLGLLLEGHNDRRQMRQQEKLQNLNMKGQKEMAQFNYDQQMKMWNATNYGPQMEQLKKAGLNPGLIYGMGGGGGATTAAAGGNVGGGQAPSGGGEVMGAIGMGLQLEMMKAQKEVMVTQAEKNRAEAAKTAGVDTQKTTAEIEQVWQGFENTKMDYELKKLEITMRNIENFEKQASQGDRMDYIENAARIAAKQVALLGNDQKVSDATIQSKITIIRQEAIGAALRNEATKVGITLTKEQRAKIAQEIAQGWEALSQKDRELKLKEIQTNFPGMSQVGGRIINDAVESIFKLTGQYRGQHYNTTKKGE